MKSKTKKLFIIFCIIMFVISPFFQYVKSLFVMSLYSYICSNKSFINKSDINIKIPGGLTTKEKDWYPFVITFNDDEGFSNFIGRDLNYTVLYNFGAFEYLNGASMIYNPQSQYYSSFYGAYFIKTPIKVQYRC